MATGKPWCRACQQRWADARPAGRPGRSAAAPWTGPLLGLHRPDASSWRACPGCGEEATDPPGRPCTRCALRRKLAGLLADGTGGIRPELRALHDNLAGVDRPATALALAGQEQARRPARARHRRAAAHPRRPGRAARRQAARHLRTILVATGTLPPRDEQLTRLETWIAQAIAGRPDPGQRQLLHRYAIWHVVRAAPRPAGREHATYGQAVAAQRNIKAAIALLDWLTARGLTLETARQGDLDAWLGQRAGQPTAPTPATSSAGPRRNKLTTAGLRSRQMGRPVRRDRHRDPLGTGPLAAARRQPQARRPRSPACSSSSTPSGRP